MFETQNFKKGSFVFLEGQQELDRFYILKTGSAERCISRFFQNSKAVQQCRVLEPGDLFGVISYLAKRPRMEAVQALEDSTVFVVKKDEFEVWIREHTDSALKIVRYLSKQLRHYDAITAGLSSKAPPELMTVRTPEHLFTMGKFYWKQKKYSLAGYAFERYLQYVSAGEQSAQAASMLAKIKASKTGMFPLEPAKKDHYRHFLKYQPIFMEGESGDELYVIQSGSVRITKVHNDQEILLDVLSLGDIFGEMALLEDKARNSNAVCAEETRLMAITRDNFDVIVRNHSAMVIRIFEVLAERLWLVYFQIANLFISNPETRLYDALYIQILRHRIQIGKNVPCTLQFTIQDILNFTGMANEEGEAAIEAILNDNPGVYVNPDGKICCSDVSEIIQRLNMIKRDSDVEKNINSSDYKDLLNKEVK